MTHHCLCGLRASTPRAIGSKRRHTQPKALPHAAYRRQVTHTAHAGRGDTFRSTATRFGVLTTVAPLRDASMPSYRLNMSVEAFACCLATPLTLCRCTKCKSIATRALATSCPCGGRLATAPPHTRDAHCKRLRLLQRIANQHGFEWLTQTVEAVLGLDGGRGQ